MMNLTSLSMIFVIKFIFYVFFRKLYFSHYPLNVHHCTKDVSIILVATKLSEKAKINQQDTVSISKNFENRTFTLASCTFVWYFLFLFYYWPFFATVPIYLCCKNRHLCTHFAILLYGPGWRINEDYFTFIFCKFEHLFPAVLYPALPVLFLACLRNLASKSTVGFRFQTSTTPSIQTLCFNFQLLLLS